MGEHKNPDIVEAPPSVLVTGATGFIGRACVQALLRAEATVEAVSSRAPNDDDARHANLRWVRADLTDDAARTAIARETSATHLLHLAWRPVSGNVWSAPDNAEWVHIGSHLAGEFLRHGGQRVVASGSCGEYDWSDGVCDEETTPIRPATAYGEAKAALCEKVLAAPDARAGQTAAWGRIFFVYGPHEHPKRLVPSVIQSLLADEPALCSHGQQIRDYMHVDDVAAGLVALLQSNASGAFNIASGNHTKLEDIINEIGRIIGKAELIRLGARPAAAHEPPVIVGTTEKMYKATGWAPRIGLADGIEDMVRAARGAA